MPVWRWRECPFCGEVAAASEFRNLTYGANWKQSGNAERECPNCGRTARTSEFRDVREKHENVESKQPSDNLVPELLVVHRYPCSVCHERMETGTFERTRDGLRLRHKTCAE